MEASAPRSEGPDAKERILRAATELIASDGIDEVRIARVANRARASTALVHHYFSTREELGIAIEECLPTPGEGEREWVLWVELWLRAAREPELRPIAGRMYEGYREWVARVIRRGVESGEFREADPDEVADVAMALFDGLGVRALIRDPAMDLDRARTLAAERLASELGVDPRSLSA